MEQIKEWWYLYKDRVLKGIIFLVISALIFIGIYFFNIMKTDADTITSKIKEEESAKTESDETSNNIINTTSINTENDKYKVDIKGSVKNPGVYEVDSNKRVEDVIQKAGGLLKDADTSVTNLSKKVQDEMVIIIYSKDEVENFTETKEKESKENNKCSNNDKLNNDSCVDNSTNTSKTKQNTSKSSSVNINSASLDELTTLTGIGEAKAKLIIEYRNKNGNFKSIEDIMNVKGIGQSLFDKIKNNIKI